MQTLLQERDIFAQISPCACGRQIGSGVGFSLEHSVFRSQYRSTKALYSLYSFSIGAT